MTCGDSSYYPMNYYPGFYPDFHDAGQCRTTTWRLPGDDAFWTLYGCPSGSNRDCGSNPVGGAREESFIENILRFNKGKMGTFYFTYQGNNKWNAMVYHGRVETAGRDHIIISDPSSGKRYLLMMANLDWVEFDEQINYPHAEINPDVQASLTTTE